MKVIAMAATVLLTYGLEANSRYEARRLKNVIDK